MRMTEMLLTLDKSQLSISPLWQIYLFNSVINVNLKILNDFPKFTETKSLTTKLRRFSTLMLEFYRIVFF